MFEVHGKGQSGLALQEFVCSSQGVLELPKIKVILVVLQCPRSTRNPINLLHNNGSRLSQV